MTQITIGRAVVEQALAALDSVSAGAVSLMTVDAARYTPHAALQAQTTDLRRVTDAQGLPSLATPAHKIGESSGHPTLQVAKPLVPFKHGCKWCGKAKCAEGCPGIQATPPAHTEAMK